MSSHFEKSQGMLFHNHLEHVVFLCEIVILCLSTNLWNTCRKNYKTIQKKRALLTLIGWWTIYYVFKIQTCSPFNHDFILKSSVCSGKSLNSQQYSLKHCPASKDSQFHWTCIPTDLCGFRWQTHPTRKAESLRRLCYLTPKSKPTFLPHDG